MAGALSFPDGDQSAARANRLNRSLWMIRRHPALPIPLPLGVGRLQSLHGPIASPAYAALLQVPGREADRQPSIMFGSSRNFLIEVIVEIRTCPDGAGIELLRRPGKGRNV